MVSKIETNSCNFKSLKQNKIEQFKQDLDFKIHLIEAFILDMQIVDCSQVAYQSYKTHLIYKMLVI